MAAAVFVAVAVGAASSAAAATSERILFERGPSDTSDREGNWELYAMNADGSSPTRLTFDSRDDFGPTTPASGARIAFASGVVDSDLDPDDPPSGNEGARADIYVMEADGSNVKRLTRDGASIYPSFSPDGSKIAFVSGGGNIDVMNADGSGRVSLTAGAGPAWSPDGSKIAFSSNRGASSPDIYVMNADGSDLRRVTTAEDPDFEPAWSPDGRQIVFTRETISNTIAIGEYEIFVINADGSGEMQLTDTPPRPTGLGVLVNPAPSWSPDGTRIAFARDDAGGPEIYVMNADGSGTRALTRNTARDLDPAFAPVPIAGPGSGPLTGRTRLRPSGVTIAGSGRCSRRSRRILRCAVRLRGQVVRPAESGAECAGGTVTVTVRFGRRRVASARTRTTPGCRYRLRKRFRLRTEGRVRRLSVTPRFSGNDFFTPGAGRPRR